MPKVAGKFSSEYALVELSTMTCQDKQQTRPIWIQYYVQINGFILDEVHVGGDGGCACGATWHNLKI